MLKKYAVTLTVTAFLLLLPHISEGNTIYKNNVLTAKHKTIPGTHIIMILPGGAKLTSSFRGFEIPGSGIECKIVEHIRVPYSESAGLLTTESLEADGIKVNRSDKAVMNGEPALMLYCTKGDENKAGLLLFAIGDKRMTSLIYASYPLNDKKAEKALFDSILSVIFQPKQEDESGGYTLSTAGTAFKFAVEANMTRYYTVDGKPTTNTVDDPSYSCSIMTVDIAPAERKNFTESALKLFMSQNEYSISSTAAININGLSGFELVADTQGARRRARTSSGGIVFRSMPGKAYQAVLFDSREGIAYAFSGIAVRDAESYITQFRNITASFKRVK